LKQLKILGTSLHFVSSGTGSFHRQTRLRKGETWCCQARVNRAGKYAASCIGKRAESKDFVPIANSDLAQFHWTWDSDCVCARDIEPCFDGGSQQIPPMVNMEGEQERDSKAQWKELLCEARLRLSLSI